MFLGIPIERRCIRGDKMNELSFGNCFGNKYIHSKASKTMSKPKIAEE